jgi:uncharacterized protein YkwD
MRRVCCLALAACAASSQQPVPTTTTATSTATASTPATSVASVTAPVVTSAGALTLAEARRYMVQLVNRDRATEHLPPVVLDEGAAKAAGQAHAEDMARLGYLGHWGSDGSVPEERITRAGGADVDFENAYCIIDEKRRGLDPMARFAASEIERAESMFFNETPPNDGHRKTILGKRRKRVGIGIAMPRALENEIVIPCISQEFIDTYGTYEPLPRSVKLGATVHVSGTLSPDVKVGAVGLGRIDEPHPLATAELNKRRFYPMPTPYELFWPHGFKTRIELQTLGQTFSIDVPVSDHNQKGLYEVSVWAQFPGEKDFAYVSVRTVEVN